VRAGEEFESGGINLTVIHRRRWFVIPMKNSCNPAVKMELILLMSAKEILLEVAEKLPPDATLSDAIYELEFHQAVQQGLDELDRGEGIPLEKVKAKIAEWAGK
jgi:hypothetical protein